MELLSIPLPVTRAKIEEAAAKFLSYGVGEGSQGSVVIRSGVLGAYIVSRTAEGRWVEAFWGQNDPHRVVDVTGTAFQISTSSDTTMLNVWPQARAMRSLAD